MMTIYNRADMARVLTLDLDPQLRALLEHRFASLVTPDGDLTDWTEFVIVEPADIEADIVRELGFSPLVEPIDGHRFGSEGFQPFWDRITDHNGWFEMVVSFGSSFACVLLISASLQHIKLLQTMCTIHTTHVNKERTGIWIPVGKPAQN